MFKVNLDAMSARESFGARIRGDLAQLRSGQQHACLLVALDPKADTAEDSVDDSVLGKLLDELPTKTVACGVNTHKLAVWLPRCSHNEAMTVARLVRSTIARVSVIRDTSADNVLTTIDPSKRIPCAIGLVFANQNNWEPDALIRTAEVTAALALIANTDSIKVAEQMRRPLPLS